MGNRRPEIPPRLYTVVTESSVVIRQQNGIQLDRLYWRRMPATIRKRVNKYCLCAHQDFLWHSAYMWAIQIDTRNVRYFDFWQRYSTTIHCIPPRTVIASTTWCLTYTQRTSMCKTSMN